RRDWAGAHGSHCADGDVVLRGLECHVGGDDLHAGGDAVVSFKDLIQAANNTAATTDRLGAQFAQELAIVLRSLERRLRPLIDDVSEGSRTAIVKASQANKARKEIEKALTESGYDDLAHSAYGSRLDPLVARVLATRRLAPPPPRLSVCL